MTYCIDISKSSNAKALSQRNQEKSKPKKCKEYEEDEVEENREEQVPEYRDDETRRNDQARKVIIDTNNYPYEIPIGGNDNSEQRPSDSYLQRIYQNSMANLQQAPKFNRVEYRPPKPVESNKKCAEDNSNEENDASRQEYPTANDYPTPGNLIYSNPKIDQRVVSRLFNKYHDELDRKDDVRFQKPNYVQSNEENRDAERKVNFIYPNKRPIFRKKVQNDGSQRAIAWRGENEEKSERGPSSECESCLKNSPMIKTIFNVIYDLSIALDQDIGQLKNRLNDLEYDEEE